MGVNFPLPSAVRSGSGNSGTITVPIGANLRADLVLTASSAPTTLNVSVDHSNDGGNSWIPLQAFTQLGAVATGSQSVVIQGPTSGQVRVSWVIVGTSYTFSVTLRDERSH